MSQHPTRILIVDDEPHVIYVTRYKLEKAGHEVFVANNGKQAYDIACAEVPDAIISDYQMPGGDGFEMAQRLKANARTAGIPIILLTARSHKLRPSELTETNVQHLMDKPFSPTDLLQKLNEMLHPAKENQTGERAA
jgi:two-component system phosphate regulon response regulator PhoB